MFRSVNWVILVTIPPLGSHFFAPPGTPLPVSGRRSYAFRVDDKEVSVIQFCREYIEALERLIQGFRQ
jgi:hypothetical protein